MGEAAVHEHAADKLPNLKLFVARVIQAEGIGHELSEIWNDVSEDEENRVCDNQS